MRAHAYGVAITRAQSPHNAEATMNATATLHLRRRNEAVRVDADGTVRVWDAVAGHYTLCHSLPAGCVRYCQARARRAFKKWLDARAVRGVQIPNEIAA